MEKKTWNHIRTFVVVIHVVDLRPAVVTDEVYYSGPIEWPQIDSEGIADSCSGGGSPGSG